MELLDFSGPVQRGLRALFGWHTVKDYWFPEVRTLAGRHPRPVGRALSLCLSLGASELRAAVDLRAGGGAHAGTDVGRRVLVGGAAAGAAGARSRRGAGADGMPERPRRRAVSRRLDPDGEHLRHLAAALEPGRRGADRTGGAAVRAGAAGGRAGGAGAEPVPSHHRALPLHPLLRSRGMAGLCRGRVLRPAGAARLRCAVRGAPRAGPGASLRCLRRRLLAGDTQQPRRGRAWRPPRRLLIGLALAYARRLVAQRVRALCRARRRPRLRHAGHGAGARPAHPAGGARQHASMPRCARTSASRAGCCCRAACS